MSESYFLNLQTKLSWGSFQQLPAKRPRETLTNAKLHRLKSDPQMGGSTSSNLRRSHDRGNRKTSRQTPQASRSAARWDPGGRSRKGGALMDMSVPPLPGGLNDWPRYGAVPCRQLLSGWRWRLMKSMLEFCFRKRNRKVAGSSWILDPVLSSEKPGCFILEK